MKVLISGATSMIGIALSHALLERGHHVIGIVRNESVGRKLLPDEMVIIESNMDEYSSLPSKINTHIDVAIALAWNGTRGADRNNHEMQLSNISNNMDLLMSVVELGCTKFMTAGSQAEYGLWNKNEKLKESEECNPNTEYGKAKLEFYKQASVFARENNITLIEPRFFSLYGPNDSEKTMVISILKKMLADEPCELTECSQLWDFLYITDAIAGIVTLIENDSAEGIYNFGSGVSMPLKKFIEVMYDETGSNSELRYGVIPYPSSGKVNVNPDVSKLKQMGWVSTIDFKTGISCIIRGYKNV